MTYTLYNNDCLQQMKTIPDRSVDMVLCDLPYGVTQNPWDSVLPLDALWEQWHRVARKDASFILFGQGMFTAKLMMSNPKEWKYNLVWDKHLACGHLNAERQPMRIHEDIVIFQRGTPPYNPQFQVGQPQHGRGTKLAAPKNQCYGAQTRDYEDNKGNTEKYPVSIVSFRKPHSSQAMHPTEKPVNLLRWLILTFTNPGSTILDSTMGSGTTGIAAVMEGRNFIGIEIDENYFNIASRRIREAEEEIQSRLF